tara:strand:- start:65 stop:1732 length:1668 start_codon:yes stop_codon:yes gene_type:complete
MDNKHKPGWYIAVLSLVFFGLWACGEDPGALIVAQVGSRQVTQGQLRTAVDALPDGFRSELRGQEARRHYLQSLVDENLMWLEIESRGLDTATVMLLPFKKKVRKQLVTIYQEREKLTQVSISGEEVLQILQRRGLDQLKERLAWGIMTETEAEIKEVIQKLKAGEPFEQVAQHHSTTPQAKEGGKLGYIGFEAARQMAIPDSLFKHLPAGEVSAYLKHSKGFFIIRFTEEWPADVARYEKEIFEELKGQKIGENIMARAEELARDFNWQLNPAGLQLLLQQSKSALQLDSPAAATPLYTFAGGQISLADFAYALKGTRHSEVPLADSAAVATLVERLLRAPALFEAAARKAGWDREPAFVEWSKNQRSLALLQALRKLDVEEKVSVEEEAIRQYYEENQQLYHERDRFKVGEVLVKTEEEALQVKREVEAGVSIVDLAKERSLRPEARRENAVLAGYPSTELAPHIMKAKIDELVGPIEVRDGYSVFKILSREKGPLQPLRQVRRQIESILRNQREQEVFGDFIQQLRQKYANQVQIYDDNLALALPEDYLSTF